MRNVPLKGFLKESPLKDVDTTLADKVYTKEKVDTDLAKKGLHTEGSLRGKTDTTPSEGTSTSGDIQMINPGTNV